MLAFVIRRAAIVLAVAMAALAAPLLTPAWACGCGAYAPEDGGTATVPMETALVRVNPDGTEDVYLSLSVSSTVRTGALLFPVPDRKASVAAGPADLFTELEQLTAPPEPPATTGGGNGNRAGAPDPGVTVENRQQIGPLDVVTLSSGDSAALSKWLQTHGFAAKPALTAAARPYTDEGWAVVAVCLRPGAESAGALSGRLDPLRIHFASNGVVYPMRLSAMASEPEQVRVYTLAQHRLDLATADPGMTVSWADTLTDLHAFPDLARITTADIAYLTRFDGTLAPASITDDFHFSPVVDDTPHRVHNVDNDVPPNAGPPASNDHTARDVGLGVAVIAVVALLAAGAASTQKRRLG